LKSSRGAIVRNVDEFARIYAYRGDSTFIALSKNMVYRKVQNVNMQNNPAISEIVSNMYIQNSHVPADSALRLSFFDAIHKLALKEQIVTPFSSMIVLVNDQQKEALKKAEAEADRFDRKIESGDEVTSNPIDPFQVSGTPEPHEWILIGLVLAFAIFLEVKRRKLIKA